MELQGNSIKTLGKVLAWIGIIGSVIGGIALCSVTVKVNTGSYYSHYETVYPYFSYGMGLIVGGVLSSWVMGVLIVAVGNLVEAADEQKRINKRMMDALEDLKKKSTASSAGSNYAGNDYVLPDL